MTGSCCVHFCKVSSPPAAVAIDHRSDPPEWSRAGVTRSRSRHPVIRDNRWQNLCAVRRQILPGDNAFCPGLRGQQPILCSAFKRGCRSCAVSRSGEA